jgi:hypothetical protein
MKKLLPLVLVPVAVAAAYSLFREEKAPPSRTVPAASARATSRVETRAEYSSRATPTKAEPTASAATAAAPGTPASVAAPEGTVPAIEPGPWVPIDRALVLEGLASEETERRRAALRSARDLLDPALEPAIEKLLETTEDVVEKELGTQVLALGQASEHKETFERLFQDDDAVVRINAAFGLARAGDVSRQEWLLSVYDVSREESPLLLPLLGEILERPELRAPVLVARYEQVANDNLQDREVRERAAEVVRRKRLP